MDKPAPRLRHEGILHDLRLLLDRLPHRTLDADVSAEQLSAVLSALAQSR